MEDILERLQRVEDVQAITQMVASYSLAADACDEEWLADFWADDAVYDMGSLGTFTGIESLMPVYRGAGHQSLVVGGSAHAGTLPFVTITGNVARAVHYATLFRQHEGRFELFRLAAAVWTFRREAGGRWKATERVLRNLDGDAAARELLGGFVGELRKCGEQNGTEHE